MPLSQNRRRILFTSPLGADAFICTGFQGRERLSRPFEFTLDLASDNTTVAAADLVGKAVGWSVKIPADGPRHFHGFVRKLVAGPQDNRGMREYRAEVVPWLWFLTRTTDCRIFQNMTVSAIITDTFNRFGFKEFKLQLQGTYPTREYCVQYRETAFAFVSRLMEEYGIYYYFEFAEGKHTLVLADTASSYFDCSPHGTVDYRPDLPTAEAISSWDRTFEFRSGKVTHTDYNFTTPSTNLLKSTSTTVQLSGLANYELYDYPGGYPIATDGQSLAKVRMEEVEAGFDTVSGSSRCSSFTPGGKFTFENHPDAGSFVLVEVEHSASEELNIRTGGGTAEYDNRFVAAPASVPFRPAAITPRPRVPGAQTAVVVGPSGEEIYTDQYGRVKVQFVWDRLGQKNENSSCWIRVSEMWAGKQWGMIFTPRIGQEVVVEFLEGDPDRPLITGRVYNAEQMPPYALPDKMTQSGLKTRSTKQGGEADFNELRFEDRKGNEDIYFHAQKDFHRFVENDDDLKVEHDQTIQIKNNRTLTVQEGYESITIQKGYRERIVSEGDDKLTVSKGMRTVVVKADYSATVQEGNRSITVSKGNDTHTISKGHRSVVIDTGNDKLTVSQGNLEIAVKAGNMTCTAATELKLVVGNNSITISTSGITLQAGGSKLELTASGVTVKGTNISLTADAQGKFSGATVNVAGSAMTEISGGLVKIN